MRLQDYDVLKPKEYKKGARGAGATDINHLRALFFPLFPNLKMSEKYEKEQQFTEKPQVIEYEEESIGRGDKEFVPPTAEELKAVMWKLDLRIIPFLGLLYLCSFLDRVNIGNAKLAGITKDLNISATDYNIALSIFFVGYVSLDLICWYNSIATHNASYCRSFLRFLPI